MTASTARAYQDRVLRGECAGLNAVVDKAERMFDSHMAQALKDTDGGATSVSFSGWFNAACDPDRWCDGFEAGGVTGVSYSTLRLLLIRRLEADGFTVFTVRKWLFWKDVRVSWS